MTDKDKRMSAERLAEYDAVQPGVLKFTFNLGRLSPICEGANGSAHELLQALKAEREYAEEKAALASQITTDWIPANQQLARRIEELQSRLDGLEIIGLAALEFVRDSYPRGFEPLLPP